MSGIVFGLRRVRSYSMLEMARGRLLDILKEQLVELSVLAEGVG